MSQNESTVEVGIGYTGKLW